MSFSHDDVQRIIQLLNESHFDELHLEADGIKLDLRRNGVASTSAVQKRESAVVQAALPATSAPVPSVSTSTQRVVHEPRAAETGCEVRAPMLGTFYSAPKPGAEPFVVVGSRVEPDTVIGIIEVMKLMNSVSAGVSGEVVEVACSDGDLVEYDQVLVRVRPN